MRLAENNQVSLEEAKKLLDKNELKEFKWTLDEYIQYGQENAIDQRWLRELENASAKFHISKLNAELLEIRAEYEKAFAKENEVVEDTIKESYTDRYDHMAYEIQKGYGVGFKVAGIDSEQLDKAIKKPWASDGKNFSDRIWSKKTQMVDTLHGELIRSMLTGGNTKEAISIMQKYVRNDVKNAKYAAARLIRTESAYFASEGQKKCFNDLNVEKYEIVATLDNRTSDICQGMDGQVFEMKDFETGVTAPPFHVNCRSTTTPYFDDEFAKGERSARGADGETYYVPSDMTYKEWKGKQDELREKEREDERYGRNKETAINKTYIESGEYRKKFDKMTDNEEVNRVLYQKAKEMLYHRSGTNFEDMVWIDGNTGEIIHYYDNATEEKGVNYSKRLLKKLKKYDNIITLHTHANSMPPSPDDFNSRLKRNYQKSYVLCHDGTIYEYGGEDEVNETLWQLYRSEIIGVSEKTKQEYALNEMIKNHKIFYKEL